MLDRALRAAFLQPRAYAEAERGGFVLLLQAVVIVAVTGAAAGVGAGIDTDVFSEGFVGGAATEIAGWVLWTLVTFWVGTRVFSATTTVGEAARTIGFAYGPGVLLAFAFVPEVGPIIVFVVTIWRWLAVFVALNVAFDINPLYTLLTALISVVPRVALGWVIGELILDIGYF